MGEHGLLTLVQSGELTRHRRQRLAMSDRLVDVDVFRIGQSVSDGVGLILAGRLVDARQAQTVAMDRVEVLQVRRKLSDQLVIGRLATELAGQ